MKRKRLGHRLLSPRAQLRLSLVGPDKFKLKKL